MIMKDWMNSAKYELMNRQLRLAQWQVALSSVAANVRNCLLRLQSEW